ncbi:unnamed protein product [Clonostachys rhizophaga]|uniref:Uncharacterized protein n=1 Tax=Clonostachys rhizophaga TaxID=160324 RepID=A0A9N9UXW7_9HYPO|nr:unnamed protein product [Clonostachys rhizophaga]
MISADTISKNEFDQHLAQYPSVIGATSASKPAKPGQKSLQELDQYRYDTAPGLFSPNGDGSVMDLDAIKALVEWKLRHGKFRPTLMSLVSSNPNDFVNEIVQEATQLYQETKSIPASLAKWTKLKGIGPATASLLLSVHDPEHVIFFSDEAFYWLCAQGGKPSIKYNVKEYQELCQHAEALSGRLGVSATDIEKVAFVLMRHPGNDAKPDSSGTKPIGSKSVSAKRKETVGPDPTTKATVRRSKRIKS